MNPFDLGGPAFLGFFATVMVGAMAAGAFLRWRFRSPGGDPPPETWELKPYEVAYLQGGVDMAVDAAIIRLVHEEALEVDVENRTLRAVEDGLRADATELERQIFAAVGGVARGADAAARSQSASSQAHPVRGWSEFAAVRAAVSPALAPMRSRLLNLGLLVAEGNAAAALFAPLMVAVLALFIGVVKIFVGVSRDRPVVFLVILCALFAVVAFKSFARGVHRSRRGDRALARLQEGNAALEAQSRRRLDEFPGDDLVLGVALFGLGILEGHRLSVLQTALLPPAVASGSSCGSTIISTSSCGGGGGCGGGGCGGCGS